MSSSITPGSEPSQPIGSDPPLTTLSPPPNLVQPRPQITPIEQIAPPLPNRPKRNAPFPVASKSDVYDSILKKHLASCSGSVVRAGSRGFALHGFETLRCGWDRFWIQSLGPNGIPRCVGGDYYTLRVQSLQMKLAVDRVVDLGNGLYEAVLHLPTLLLSEAPDPIGICADLTLSNTPFDGMDHFAINATTLGNVFSLPHYKMLKHDASRSSCVPRKPMSVSCINASRYMCDQRKKDPPPICGRHHNVVPGAWLQTPPAPEWTHPFWYYPRDCTLRYYGPIAARKCLRSKWIVGWGDSTMKQAMCNFLEGHLNESVVEGVFMRDIDRLRQTLPKKKRAGLPNFFTYRQWDRKLDELRVSMAWGGCLWVSATPGCHDVAMRNRAYLEKLLVPPGRLPDMISMTHHIWRYPWHDEFDFIELVRDTVRWIHGFYDGRGQRRPLLIWNNGPKIANDEHWNRCRLPAETYEQHVSWALEDALRADNSPLVFVDRWALTAPFHIDTDGFVHTGVHYGSTMAMCMTSLAYKRMYDPVTCARTTYPETAMVQVWLNMLCNA